MEIQSFFNRAFEQTINEKLFFRKFVLNKETMADYIQQVVSIPIGHYIDYVVNNISVAFIEQTSVVQYSSVADATTNLCKCFEDAGDSGLDFVSIGRLLMNDGVVRNDGAYRKYGENHVKLALELSLVQECYGYYYLSCLGKMFNEIDEYTQERLLQRTVLRNKLVQRVVKDAALKKVFIADYISFLSESTIKRRMPNLKGLFSILGKGDPGADEYLFNIEELGSVKQYTIQTNMPSAADLTFAFGEENETEASIKEESGSLILKKEISASFFDVGFTIPQSCHQKILDVVGGEVPQGHSTFIKVKMDDDIFEARISHVFFSKSHQVCYQLLWSKGSRLSSRLKEKMADAYEYYSEEKKMCKKRQRVELPDKLKYEVLINQTGVENMISFTIVKSNEKKEIL